MPIDLAHLFSVLSSFGAWGVLVGYLIWREQCDRKERKERFDIEQAANDKDIASREKLATSLTALCMVIQGRPGV